MTLLLDTCVLLWFFVGSDRISEKLKMTLTNPHHDLLMSDVSVLELVIKHSLGKISLPQPPSKLLPLLAAKHRIDTLSLKSEDIYYLEQLPSIHPDPFDRLLIAQATTGGFRLVTPDPLIHRYDAPILWQ
ncbi:MAG TPA: type II toxin-antitoxin system VapC family toxin [Candidatus Paceibacterota bacterium]|nr:type II toxin-antitoxin system VapC family toxin [Candidatus Paceibacterota bacterium]